MVNMVVKYGKILQSSSAVIKIKKNIYFLAENMTSKFSAQHFVVDKKL